MAQLGKVALGLGIAAWAILLLNAVIPFVGCFLTPFGPICAIAAIIVGIIAMGGEDRHLAIIGTALGGGYLLVWILMIIFALVFGAAFACLYFGLMGLIFGGTICGNLCSNVMLPMALMAALAAVRVSRLRLR